MIDVLTVANSIAGCVPGDDASTLELPCTKHPSKGLCVQLRVDDDKLQAASLCGCKEADLLAMLAEQSPAIRAILDGAGFEGAKKSNDAGFNSASGVSKGGEAPDKAQNKDGITIDDSGHATAWQANGSPNGTNGNGLIHGKPSLFQWQMYLYERGKIGLDALIKAAPEHRAAIAAAPVDAFIETVQRLRNKDAEPLSADPDGLSQTDIEEQIEKVAVALRDKYAPVPATVKQKRELIVVEQMDDAHRANAEYLARPEVIEGLGYSQSITLIIGGKHTGKTTNIRTLALAKARGLPIWGRKTTAGHVIYCASDDEIVSTRNELLSMGWHKGDPLVLVRLNNEVDATREQIIDDIAEVAVKNQTELIILDMLFDFTGIKNELSYAETREAINLVQHLADKTKALVVASHHTPKYLSEFHNASNAALGSQGISARFSPIILVRKWTERLFSIESTPTRDPRGKALVPTKIVRNADGWIETAGEFKEWMKWEVFADKVMSIFEGGGEKEGYTVYAVADKTGIERSKVQTTLYQLTQSGKLKREKQGRSYRYYLASTSMFDREGGNFDQN